MSLGSHLLVEVEDDGGGDANHQGGAQCWPWLKHLFAGSTHERGRRMSQVAHGTLCHRNCAQACGQEWLSTTAPPVASQRIVRVDDGLASVGEGLRRNYSVRKVMIGMAWTAFIWHQMNFNHTLRGRKSQAGPG